MAAMLVFAASAYAPTVVADNSFAALTAQRRALQAEVGKLGADQTRALDQLLLVQDRLAGLRSQVATNQAELGAIGARLKELQAQIRDARRRIDTTHRSLNALAREQYKFRVRMSPDQVFFASSDLSEVVNRMIAEKAVGERQHTLLAELRIIETALTAQTQELGQRQAQARQLQADLATRKAALQSTAADYQARVNALKASAAGLLAQINALDKQIAALNRPPAGGYTPSQQQVMAIIREAAARWNQDADRLIRVARCESGLNPRAYNRSSGASGLFQFMPGTFYGNGGHDIWDAADQSNIAAKMFSQGRSGAWGCH
jgi:peptidoglycan hydrolase CwlO-like protein